MESILNKDSEEAETSLTYVGKQPVDVNDLAKLTKKYKSGKIPPVDWLDRLTFAEIEKVSQKKKQSSNLLFLMVEFPPVHYEGKKYSIVYFEHNGDIPIHVAGSKSQCVRVFDPEILKENLVEAKHHKLARANTDKDLKPNAEIRDHLIDILRYPTTRILTSEEKDLVWRYRFYLSANKKALAKFVKCVDWNVNHEANQALELIHKWAPMDVVDALELLGPTFKNPGVRRYAVSRLKSSKDDDLQLYLLQLVQALKYENFPKTDEESLTSSQDLNLSTHSSLPPSTMQISQEFSEEEQTDEEVEDSGLAQFLIDRASRNSILANYFYWYLVIECGGNEEKILAMYKWVLKKFESSLKSGPPEFRERDHFLKRQRKFVDGLVKLVREVTGSSGKREQKIDLLRKLLGNADQGDEINFVQFNALQLPLDPDVKICGVLPEKATLFKSSLMPARLTFKTETNEEYVTIFKNGDDLRQDQLVLQIITLMDRILQQENLDLKLTPYRVLACSSKHGFVQYVDSSAVAEILNKDGSILNFFRKHHPFETGPYAIHPDVMDNYVKSCAGYCVITYLLGVGDRHLDNLLLTKDGKLFHIDFGFILGRDPKPLPPPMKLSKEMIDGFGGEKSEHYQEFKKECYTAFLSLRRYANLILNLFSLMVDASVPDIALEPDKTVKKVEDKFQLDLSDEEAVKYMETVIELSAQAFFAPIAERIHKLAQFWRN